MLTPSRALTIQTARYNSTIASRYLGDPKRRLLASLRCRFDLPIFLVFCGWIYEIMLTLHCAENQTLKTKQKSLSLFMDNTGFWNYAFLIKVCTVLDVMFNICILILLVQTFVHVGDLLPEAKDSFLTCRLSICCWYSFSFPSLKAASFDLVANK